MTGNSQGTDRSSTSGKPTEGVRRLLEMLKGIDRPQLGDVPLSTIRKVMDMMAPRLDMAPPKVASHQETIALAEGLEVPVTIIRPVQPAERPAVLVYLHGGGFVIGSRQTHDRVCRYLANASGATVINVEYRLAPEHPFPGGLDDCVAATLWAAAQSDLLAGQEARLFVAGDSAGANLAIAVAHRLLDREASPDIAGLMLVYPVTDFSQTHPSRLSHATGKFLETKAMDWYEKAYIGSAEDRLNPLVSPLLSPSLGAMPPSYVLTAELDILHDEGVALADRLRAAGCHVTASDWPGLVHGFINMGGVLPEAQQALDELGAWVRRTG